MPGSFRNYGKIDPYIQFQHENKRKARRRIFIIVASSVFLVVALICIVVGVTISNRRSSHSNSSVQEPEYSTGSNAIQVACNTTAYPDVCEQTLSSQPGALTANPLQLVTIAVQVALTNVENAYNYSLSVSQEHGLSHLEVVAAQDCAELMDGALEELNVSISKLSSLGISSLKSSLHDVQIYLSSASSEQAACEESLDEAANGSSIQSMLSKQDFVSKVILNALGLVQTLSSLGSDISSWKKALPSVSDIFHFRRRLMSASSSIDGRFDEGSSYASDSAGYPEWLSAGARRLLQAPISSVQGVDITVAADGSGDYTTVTEALHNVPEDRTSRFTIYVKAGTYDEGPLNVTKDMTDLTLIGDGCNVTVITGSANVGSSKYTTYRSATVGIAAKGFIAKDITFKNTAGPPGFQAVAVRSNAEEIVFASCCFEGYQDTLYALSGKQFFTNCKILGSVDYIFGAALAVFQTCDLIARLPLQGQQVTYTAQGKKQKELVSGFSFQFCTLSEGDDLKAATIPVSVYLGRPWKAYSTAVFMQSEIGSLVDPAGWLSWNTSQPFQSTCYYAEYDNNGPGSDVSKRAPWSCVHPSLTADDATQFTVDTLLTGSTWIPSDVEFISGLTS